jgi:hypothetical protein
LNIFLKEGNSMEAAEGQNQMWKQGPRIHRGERERKRNRERERERERECVVLISRTPKRLQAQGQREVGRKARKCQPKKKN